MTPAIALESIQKTYPGAWGKPAKEALKGVSLSIGAGEVFGLIGPNGAGKSTLIKVLIGALRSTSGSAQIFGRDVSDPEARKGLGFVPENPSLQDFLTPYEILLMGLRLHQVRVNNERQHCLRWLERFDLTSVADSRLRGFSKGMMQRTALAHALAIQPRLLILDEPLSGLDPVGRRDVVDILAEYRRDGGTIFFTSHVLHDVERLADRFGLVVQGAIKTISSPADLVNGEHLVTLRTSGNAVLDGFSRMSGNQWQAEVRREELWLMIDHLRSLGHQIIEIKPTLSLESAFFRYMEDAEHPVS